MQNREPNPPDAPVTDNPEADPGPKRPRWRRLLSERLALGIGGAMLSLAILAGSAYLAHATRIQAIEAQQQRADLLADAFEGHVSRTLAAIDTSLGAAGRQIAEIRSGQRPAADVAHELAALTRGTSALRSASLVDAQGRVVASTHPQNVGMVPAASQLGIDAAAGPALRLGQLLSVGDLHEMRAPPSGQTRGANSLVAIKPVPGENSRLLVLINPDELLPGSRQMLEGDRSFLTLSDLSGRILASAGPAPYPAGLAQPQLPAPGPLSAHRESGNYRQAASGDTGDSLLVHYRWARPVPVAVAVSRPEGSIAAASTMSRQIIWAGLAAAIAVALATVASVRALGGQARAAEQMRHARDAAESANAAKSAFLANMSHEIRTPVNSMVGMTELALATNLSPAQREYLTLARESSGTLLRLIDDILDFSRAESGKLELEEHDFDLHRLCQLELRNFSLPAAKKNIELVLDIGPDVPVLVRGDSLRLGQILLNLIGNAIKFTPSGWVRLGVRRAADGDADLLAFEVQDCGIGVPAHLQADIFNAFSQGDASTNRRYGGSGLGLAICERLVRLMGGQIAVDSLPGKGSTFRFTCALAPALVPATEPQAAIGNVPLGLLLDTGSQGAEVMASQLRSLGLQPVGLGSVSGLGGWLHQMRDSAAVAPVLLLDARQLGPEVRALLAGWDGPQTLTALVLHPVSQPPALAALGAPQVVCRGITLPATNDDLREALAQASGSVRRAAEVHQRAANARPGSGLRVLLVEDTPMNQKLATMVLDTLGAAVDIAVDGMEGVRMRQLAHYDLVLMDLQMPQVDGVQATSLIREWERKTGQPPVRIVAMTAHGLERDHADCIAAGMDDFLVKPVALADYQRILQSCGAQRRQSPSQPNGGQVLDVSRALAFVGNEAGVMNMLPLLASSLDHDVPEITRLLDAGDVSGANRLLHPLKGFVPIFCVDSMVDKVTQVEQISKTGSAPEVQAAVTAIRPALAQLADEIRSFMQPQHETAA